jgi:ParB family chromosome partitioning protein
MALNLKDRLARQAAGGSQLQFDPTGRDEPRLVELYLSVIDPDPNQPRRDLGDLTDLALSIREHGVLQPIIVEGDNTGRYRILAGERRFAACRSLGLESIPCIVRTVAEQSRLALQIIENLHRKDLHPLEEARSMRRLMEEFNLSQRELAQRVSKSLGAVNQILRILDLDAEVLSAVERNPAMNKSLLLEIAKQPDPARQKALWDRAQAGELTVREARNASTGRPSPKSEVCTIRLPDSTVQVRFQSGEATRERVAIALGLAMERQTAVGE